MGFTMRSRLASRRMKSSMLSRRWPDGRLFTTLRTSVLCSALKTFLASRSMPTMLHAEITVMHEASESFATGISAPRNRTDAPSTDRRLPASRGRLGRNIEASGWKLASILKIRRFETFCPRLPAIVVWSPNTSSDSFLTCDTPPAPSPPAFS